MSQDMVRQGEFGKDLGLLHEVVVTGRKVGANQTFYAALAHDEELFRRIIEMACGLQSDLLYDAKTVASLLGIQYSEQELTGFGPPPGALPGFLTFFDPGPSLLRLRETVSGKGTIFYPQDWYEDQAFANKRDKPCYRQIRIEGVKGSFDKTFDQQQKLVSEDEEIPFTRVVVMGMVVHFLFSGQRLYPNYWVRCLDKVSDGCHVRVGRFDGRGLDVDSRWDGGFFPNIGLVTSRKS